jgi:4'-phosphopantetheinyl transferase
MIVQDIWLLPLPDMPYEQLLDREGHVMTDSEVAQLQNKRLPKGKHMYAFTRIALRHVLSRYETHVDPGQWRFTRQGAGKPTIAYPESRLRFNLTHADDMLVIVVSDHAEVGVDVEDRQRDVDVMALARRYYQPDEIQALAQQGDEQAQRLTFLTLWTLKEAAVKATGQGLSKALRDFSFELLPPKRIVVSHEQQPEFWTFAWRHYLLSCARLAESPCQSHLATHDATLDANQDDTVSQEDWRCFCWEWPGIHPEPVVPELLWHT